VISNYGYHQKDYIMNLINAVAKLKPTNHVKHFIAFLSDRSNNEPPIKLELTATSKEVLIDDILSAIDMGDVDYKILQVLNTQSDIERTRVFNNERDLLRKPSFSSLPGRT